MELECHSHNDADKLIPKELVLEITQHLTGVDAVFQKNGVKEIRKEILNILFKLGWSKPVRLDRISAITITSVKSGVGLCVQTGNMSRYYADIVKLQAAFTNKKISSAIFITPSKEQSKKLGSNLANFDRINLELDKIFKKTITMPIYVIGIG